MTRLYFEETVRGPDDFPDPEVAPDQIWLERDLVCPVLSADEAFRLGVALAASPHPSGFFFSKYDKEEACYFADPGVRTALADVARVAANRSPAPCRIH